METVNNTIMDGDKVNFTFIYIPNKLSKALEDKTTKEYLIKWSLKGNLRIQYYCFNQPFIIHQRDKFAEAFFKDPAVYTTLLGHFSSGTWIPTGIPASTVEVETVPCTITSLAFFDRLLDPENNVVRSEGSIIQCLDEEVKGFLVGDKLRDMLLNEECKEYNLYSDSERKQFLFCIFQHLCLGGQWCQYESAITAYIDKTKCIYKDLLSVEKVAETNEFIVRSVVLKVKTFDRNGIQLLPSNDNNIQNFLYLIIDPFKRNVTTFMNQQNGVMFS